MISKIKIGCLLVFALVVSAGSAFTSAEENSNILLLPKPVSLLEVASSYTGSCGGSTDTGLSCKSNERPVCDGDKCECVVYKDCGG